MQVRPIADINKIKSANSKPSNSPQISKSFYQPVSFSNITSGKEISGRYLAFKGAKSFEEKAVDDFMVKKINPFLKEYEEISNKNKAIHESSEKLMDLYWQGLRRIKNDYSPLTIIGNDPVVIKNLTIPLKYRANLNEYKYLRTNLENTCVMSNETKNFAKEIEHQMHNSKLDSYDDALKLMKKSIIDIKNGQNNALEHTSKSFNVKIEGTKKAKDLSLGSMYITDEISCFKNRYEKFQKETDSTVKNKKFAELNEEIPKLDKLLKYANEVLRGRTEEAETLANYNKLTEDIVKEQLESVESRYKKIADKNIKALYKYFDEHPELIRNEATDKKDERFLKKQEYLNIKLWQRLQDDKKDFNKESKIQYEEFQAQHGNSYPLPYDLDDPDLPF